MKILYVSDVPVFNHIRIEKGAHTAKKMGWETFFAGPHFNKHYALDESVFEDVFRVSWSKWARLGISPYYNWVKRKLKRAIRKLKPDIIHAYNIFSAKIIKDLGYPLVFEDAEFYSRKKIGDVEWDQSTAIDKAAANYLAWKWSKWEKDVAEGSPVLTVSNSIARAYAELGAKTFVVPNYPSVFELSKANWQDKAKTFTVAYLGNDISKVLRPYRDTRGITAVMRDVKMPLTVIGDNELSSEGVIDSRGFIPHLRIYEVLSRCHVGIVPWRNHWIHRYLNPNKPYLYAHCGLVVVIPSSLIEVVDALKGNCRTIDQISDLKILLRDLSNKEEEITEEERRIKDYARKNLIWELHEKRILEAYGMA